MSPAGIPAPITAMEISCTGIAFTLHQFRGQWSGSRPAGSYVRIGVVGLLDTGRSSRDPEISSAASADGSVCWARLGQAGSPWTQENPRDLRTKSSTASL